jgi:predicted permease
MPVFVGQVRIAVRSLGRTPVVTIAAVVSLALGLGATTAVFSAVNAALLEGLPFYRQDRLVSVFRTTPHFRNGPFAPANFLDLRAQTTTLSALGAVSYNTALLKETDGTTQVSAYAVSGEVFSLLGVTPKLGRVLGPVDEEADQPLVAMVSGELFRTRFGSDPSLIGSTVLLDGEAHTIIGVLSDEFRIPHRTQNLSSDFWVPLRFTEEQAQRRRNNYLQLLGRLADGRAVAEAEAELVTLMAGIADDYPEVRGESVRAGVMQRESAGPVQAPLLLMLGAVGLVLLIATANVASLILARGAERGHEVALRTALGASRGSIVRGVLMESGVIATAGIALGLGIAWFSVGAIGTLGARIFPQLEGLGLDGPVVAFAVIITAMVAVWCGIIPAWHIAKSDPQDALRSGTRAGIARAHHRFLRGLVVTEVAVSALLLLGAGLLVRSFLGLLERSPGFDSGSLLTMVVDVSPERYTDVDAVRGFLLPGLEAVRNLPGVEDAGIISRVPYINWGNNFNIRYEGVPGDDPTQLPLTENRVVTPSFFSTFEMTLLRGRMFTNSDGALEDSPPLVVVNEALVKRDFPEGDVIGKRFHSGDTFATIIGVVSDIRNVGPIRDPAPEVYWNITQGSSSWTRFPLVVRSGTTPTGQARAITTALRSIDPDVAVTRVLPMDDAIERSMGRQRFFMLLLGSFAGVALVLSVTGLYGVISYAVARRTRELGIRAALGSTRSRTIGLVLRDALALALVGLVVGATAGAGLTRLLTGMLYGVSPLNPTVWSLALATLFTTAVIASYIPALRAARVDPLEAIRCE